MKRQPLIQNRKQLSGHPSLENLLDLWESAVCSALPEAAIKGAISARDGKFFIRNDLEREFSGSVYLLSLGKAAYRMAAATSQILIDGSVSLRGRVLLPEGEYEALPGLDLHPIRPVGYNYPTADVVQVTQRVLEETADLGSDETLLCLVSGGGSALLECPREGIELESLVAASRFLARNGADIAELNCVRSCLSKVKCGGLARASNARHIEVLIMSDVPGDDLKTIASGPLLEHEYPSALQAVEIFSRYRSAFTPSVISSEEGKGSGEVNLHQVADFLFKLSTEELRVQGNLRKADSGGPLRVQHHLIASNNSALTAALKEAQMRNLPCSIFGRDIQGSAEDLGRDLAQRAVKALADGESTYMLYGGETTVTLPQQRPTGAKGGRNLRVALSFIQTLLETASEGVWQQVALVSAGSDGEDGPTDVAGAFVSPQLLASLSERQASPRRFLETADEYSFFKEFGGLIYTGLTGTNVSDLGVLGVGLEELGVFKPEITRYSKIS